MSYSPETIDHFIWRYRHFNEDNKSAPFHYRMVDYYLNADKPVKPIKAFRGSAKSTNTCYMALHRVEKPSSYYTLIVSDTATQAESLIADIADMIEDSRLPYKLIRSVTGEIQLRYGGKDYYIVGKGAGASMRGIKRGRKRPDLIILDDIINDQLVMNRLRVDRLNRWFFKALLPSLDPRGEVWAVGTPLSQNDLFMLLCSQYGSLDIPIEQDGEPAWSDRFPLEWIQRKKHEYEQAGMLREWKQEYELVVTDRETQLFPMDKVHFEEPDEVPECTWFMTCDLAFSESESADYSAIIVNGIDRKGQWHVYAKQGRWKPSETAGKIFELVDRFGVVEVGIEQGSSYLAVIEHLEELMSDYQRYFPVGELKHRGKSKISRISSLEPVVRMGKLTIIDDGDAEALVEQMELTDVTGCRASNDDCFSGDTLVRVNGKVMRFDEIPSEGWVTGYDGKPVRYINGGVRHRRFSLCSIKLSDGTIIKATPNHEFLTFNNGKYEWVKTIDLQGKQLCRVKSLTDEDTVSVATDTITGRQEMESTEQVCTGTYGSTTTERYLTGILSTIKTTIKQTTIYRILSSWKKKLISRITRRSGTVNTVKRSKSISTVSETSQKSGISLKKAESGTSSMWQTVLQKLGLKIKMQPAQCAENTLKQQKQMLNTALITAAKRREEIAESMTLIESAQYAGKSSEPINTPRHKLVVENVELNLGINDVYCMEVPRDSCFSLADGTIVSNCVDALAYQTQMNLYYADELEMGRDDYAYISKRNKRNVI